MEAVIRDFGDGIHTKTRSFTFYEHFLEEYDARRTHERGVFYTPRRWSPTSCVAWTRLLRTSLVSKMDSPISATWGETGGARRYRGNSRCGLIPSSRLFKSSIPLRAPARSLWRLSTSFSHHDSELEAQPVTDARESRLAGTSMCRTSASTPAWIRALMAPYAIAHLKVGLKLYETGYRFQSDERARIYLTNALEPPSDDSKQMILPNGCRRSPTRPRR